MKILPGILNKNFPIIIDDSTNFPWESDGGSINKNLDLTDNSVGIFTRNSEGSYFLGAPTNGSTAFIGWADVNIKRIEDRGDGLGPMYLSEGSRTNNLIQSRDMSNINWSTGTATLTSNANGGVDGATLADQENAGLLQFSAFQSGIGIGPFCNSVWARAVSVTASHQIVGFDGEGGVAAHVNAITTTYMRNDVAFTSSLNYGCLPLDARDWSSSGGQVATEQNCYLDLTQCEEGRFPSSPIRTTTGAVSRGADNLSYSVSQYPPSFLDRGFRLTFAPDATSAEQALTSGGHFTLVSFDANNYLLLLSSAGNVFLQLITQNATRVSTTLTWVARGQLLTIDCRPSLGQVTIAGASTGNGTFTGTPCVFDAGTLVIGARPAGLSHAFGRFGTTIVGL